MQPDTAADAVLKEVASAAAAAEESLLPAWDALHLRRQEELQAREASIPMTIEAKPGYVRCELAFPIRGYQLLEHPDAPALRVLAMATDDGPVALLMNKEIAETIGQALLRVAKQMLEKRDLS
jgi:hypothetical protein